ncbi:MAG: ribosome small subunit-dependent GTPase A [Acidimicrobiales bacterium]
MSLPASSPPPSPTLAELGWDDPWATALAQASTGDALTPARVARSDPGSCTALSAAGALRAVTSRRAPVAVGDWVGTGGTGRGSSPGDPPRVEAVLPRRSAFSRAAEGRETREQVVAANLDTVLLAQGLDGRLSLSGLERYLALGWQSGAVPAVVLTKADLASPEHVAQRAAAVEGIALGVPVHVLSAATGEGLEGLAPYLVPGRTIALLGPSGVGKSTLVNRLAGEELQATGDVRSDGKGRHTTTRRELVVLPGGGVLVDTPGMRAVGLWDAEGGVERAFSDVERLAGECRFSDCSHTVEPRCAVLDAVAAGRLDRRRLESWRKLQRELRHLAGRQDARLRAEEQRRWKALTRAGRGRR